MRLLLTTALSFALLGCTTATNMGKSDRRIDDGATVADQALADARIGQTAVPAAGLRVIDDKTFVTSTPIHLDAEVKQAPSCQITYTAENATLLEFGQIVSKTCGVVVRVTPDALRALKDVAPTSAAGGAPAPMSSIPPPIFGSSSMDTSGFPAEDATKIAIRYSGELTGLLNAVTARQGVSWRFRDNVITIFYLDTRGFRIYSIPTATSMKSTVKSGATASSGVTGNSGSTSGGGGAGGGAGGVSGESSTQQVTEVSLDTNQSADLTKSVESMLTPNVGRMSMAASSGILSVTDTPEALDRIALYVDSVNEFSTKQVLLNVKVISVQMDDSDELGINWEAIYTNLADSYGIGLVSQFAKSPDAISGSVNILEGNSRFSGSQLVVNALSKQGKVSVVTQPSVTTLNMEPVPVQVAKQTSYLAQSMTTLTSDVGATTTLTPGTVTTGFNMNLLPYILPDSKTIILQYSVNLSTLIKIRRVESGESAIEIPEVDSRILSQKVRMKTGETLVLSGFEQATDANSRSGVGNPKFWVMGGGLSAKQSREVLVVLITPMVTG